MTRNKKVSLICAILTIAFALTAVFFFYGTGVTFTFSETGVDTHASIFDLVFKNGYVHYLIADRSVIVHNGTAIASFVAILVGAFMGGIILSLNLTGSLRIKTNKILCLITAALLVGGAILVFYNQRAWVGIMAPLWPYSETAEVYGEGVSRSIFLAYGSVCAGFAAAIAAASMLFSTLFVVEGQLQGKDFAIRGFLVLGALFAIIYVLVGFTPAGVATQTGYGKKGASIYDYVFTLGWFSQWKDQGVNTNNAAIICSFAFMVAGIFGPFLAGILRLAGNTNHKVRYILIVGGATLIAAGAVLAFFSTKFALQVSEIEKVLADWDVKIGIGSYTSGVAGLVSALSFAASSTIENKK